MAAREGPNQVSLAKIDPKGAVKIGGKTGLECDNQTTNFETVRGDVKVKSGKWYFEVALATYGKFQIGWCSENCKPQPTYSGHEIGIGNDSESWGFDGSTQRAWTANASQKFGEYWSQGDVIGCILDLDNKLITYFRNGNELGAAFTGVNPGSGLYPAASLGRKQKCTFNFGAEAFKYPIMEFFPDVRALHITMTKSQQTDLEKTFEKYRVIGNEDNDDFIRGDGITKYVSDLGIAEDKDPGFLLICWKLNLTNCKCWELSKEQFVTGWASHQAFNIEGMKKKLSQWRDDLKVANRFKEFYFFVFDYLKEDKKILSIEECLTVWDLIGFTEKRWPMMPKWIKFVTDKKSLSRDTWRLFYSFAEQYPKDISNYDPEGCWPCLIDEFVEHELKGGKGKAESN